jgi:2-oxoacid:acceptor oxidoreductase gamma subunit (pyruvate/2-ketoisovalerate family)
MIEIRFHGRGGQGAVIASQLLAMAAFKEGKYVVSFPYYGVERRGAPVTAFTRISDRPIRIKSQIYEPDYVIVMDTGLMSQVDVLKGLKPDGWVLLNTTKRPEELGVTGRKAATVDATGIAIKHGLGSKAAPIVNTAIIGAFARLSGLVSIESVVDVLLKKSPAAPEKNAAAAKDAYEALVFYER